MGAVKGSRGILYFLFSFAANLKLLLRKKNVYVKNPVTIHTETQIELPLLPSILQRKGKKPSKIKWLQGGQLAAHAQIVTGNVTHKREVGSLSF